MNESPVVKLCVIDDIRSVVDMIARKPSWHEHRVEVVGTALDGEEGLRLVRELKPDIVLTDIRMPRMDGLAMTEAILEVSPHIKIVILSAYTDFSYTQQAIRLGAFDFIKKPFSIDEIVKVVLKAKKAYEEEMREHSERLELEKSARTSMPMLQREYVSLLVHHPASEERALKEWEQLKIELEPRHFNIFIVELDHFPDKYGSQPAREIELIQFAVRNILEETIAAWTRGMVFREGVSRFICIVNCIDNITAQQISEACRANISQFAKSTVSVGVGLCVDTISELPHSYAQALSALSYHFYTEGDGVNSYSPSAGRSNSLPTYSISTEQEFLFALRSGNKDNCLLILERIFNKWISSDPLPKPQYVENLCMELSNKINRLMLEYFPPERVFTLERKYGSVNLRGYSTFQEMRERIRNHCTEACGWMEEERSDESVKLIYQAKDYICANLQLNLSLEHCAKQVNLSPGYFSNLFKKVLGISYQQFVTQQKMEKAKSMLIDGYQVQEIALTLGYEHRRYFSEIFKKYTGMTPSEFKAYSMGKSASSQDNKS
ncbi:response regulator [Paenibacillus sp. OAS669]|uniref:response regulator n=1 Tax=Paenibacillus sp. OAS669 TaxID=2663821 RepID=UPI0019ED459C|nr:response regulator [Paenibacillus sp. OAS669]MBE1445322.1 two-component system response regulator YesN [Paenibacillus sp. OAS669]